MKKATITIAFDSEKLDALEFSLHKEHSSAQAYLESALNAAYEKTVPAVSYTHLRAHETT